MSKSVLCIDDSRAVHAFLKDCLKETGYTVTSAMNGEEAVKMVEAKGGPMPFDLIFLDWEMPGLTGPQVFDKFVGLKIKTPVLMLTSKNSTDDIKTMLDKGVAEYVLKPFTRDIILEKINSILNGF